MKAFLVLTDVQALRDFELAFRTERSRGFTVVPILAGMGRTGLKAGTRVHPGASGMLLTVVEEADADATVAFLRRLRDEAGAAGATKIYALPAEEI